LAIVDCRFSIWLIDDCRFFDWSAAHDAANQQISNRQSTNRQSPIANQPIVNLQSPIDNDNDSHHPDVHRRDCLQRIRPTANASAIRRGTGVRPRA
jgi:hypothetical protein